MRTKTFIFLTLAITLSIFIFINVIFNSSLLSQCPESSISSSEATSTIKANSATEITPEGNPPEHEFIAEDIPDSGSQNQNQKSAAIVDESLDDNVQLFETIKKESIQEEQRTSDDPYKKIAVVLKTGHETYLSRTPIQLVTFLRNITNLILVGDVPNLAVGTHQIEDMVTHIYDSYDERPDDWEHLIEELNGKTYIYSGIEGDKKKVNGEEMTASERRDNLGWKADAHKNIPAYRSLYRQFPDSEWFVMIDDDTFFDFDNFNVLVSNLDPLEPHYFGNVNRYSGRLCGGKGLFAHGGSGIVMSLGAMLILEKAHDKCMIKFKDCWAGDVRLGQCLADAGVPIGRPKDGHFSSEPPTKIKSWPAPCDRPNTFHHLSTPQFQKLFECKMNANNLLTYADVYQCFGFRPLEENTLVADANLKGSDFKHFRANDKDDCVTACLANERCYSWSYDKNYCWLKDGIPDAKESNGTISGIIAKDYKCSRGIGKVG